MFYKVVPLSEDVLNFQKISGLFCAGLVCLWGFFFHSWQSQTKMTLSNILSCSKTHKKLIFLPNVINILKINSIQ